MEINKEEFKIWITALRSGMYTQTTGVLQDAKGHCCLGVACKVLIPEGQIKFKRIGLELTNFLYGNEPSDQPLAPTWLKKINDDFGDKNEGYHLIYLNDNDELTFIEIADLLERKYFPNGYQ